MIDWKIPEIDIWRRNDWLRDTWDWCLEKDDWLIERYLRLMSGEGLID